MSELILTIDTIASDNVVCEVIDRICENNCADSSFSCKIFVGEKS
ncbi:hypothetical protein [Clostridium sp. C2-6-12]|nr:hypothetical protein [Clostridium sp. C2-6-12]